MKSETAEIDIVERLRGLPIVVTENGRTGISRMGGTLLSEAADEIERLRWENANMEKLWGKSEGTWMEIRDKQDAEIELLRKERDGLLEALGNILSVQPIKDNEGSADIISLAKALLEIDSIARAALKEKE